MRRREKEEALQLLTQMRQVNQRLMDLGGGEALPQALMECQNAAIAIGTLAERDSAGESLVGILEVYCEKLYEASVAWESMGTSGEETNINIEIEGANKSEPNQGNPVSTLLMCLEACDTLLTEATQALEALPAKRQMVFFPYKVSMWDSLESVWRAADADPLCEALVVPIPYYDKNPDGSFGEMHYEGDRYPQNVPIVSYKDYDLELEHPEVALIHNPYDDGNLVTSVHPMYYSYNLKKHTDKLVYIPYFVVDESQSLAKLDHYALASAVIHSDLVIVQSEKVRAKYIEVLDSYFQSQKVPRSHWEQKVLGLGSPKFDALAGGKPSLDQLPESWRRVLGDGTKKVIFYNTHLSDLMKQNYKYGLSKLRDVLDFFKKRDDVVLLWRPHPLAVSTAQSMNPIAVEPYLEIVNRYKEEGWGIYDDTPSMELGMRLSDAYYGAATSVLAVYKASGKPVLISNIFIPVEG